MANEVDKGLNISGLIAAPLQGAAEASSHLAQSTAAYIDTVGFTKSEPRKPRQVDFMFERPQQNETGDVYIEEVHVQLPLLAIAPAPNLQIDSVEVEFTLEVRSVSNESDQEDMSGHADLVEENLQIYGATTAHKDHTRGTDKSSKYHFTLRATNHGVPEAMARILDMMASSVAPHTINSNADARPVGEQNGEGNSAKTANSKRAKRASSKGKRSP